MNSKGFSAEQLRKEIENVYVPFALKSLYYYMLEHPPVENMEMDFLLERYAKAFHLSKFTVDKMMRRLKYNYFIDFKTKAGPMPYQRLLESFEFLGSYIWIEFDK